MESVSKTRSSLFVWKLCSLRTKLPKGKLWSSGRALGSQSEGRGSNPHPMLDGSGVKAMPGLIPTPNSGTLLKNYKIQVAKWGTPKKKTFLHVFYKQ
jgi:hypothetical protein